MIEHILGHGVQVVVGRPAPVVAGGPIVGGGRPGIGNLLALVGLVRARKTGDVALDGGSELLGRKAHGADVVAVTHGQRLGVGSHEIEGGLEGIGHVHHGQARVAPEEAGVGLPIGGRREHVDGIVGDAAARRRFVAQKAGVAKASHIDVVAAVVIPAQQLAAALGDPVHRGGIEHRLLRDLGLGRAGPKDGDGARPEDLQITLPGEVEDVLEAAHVDVPGVIGPLFAGGREKTGQVVHDVDVIAGNDLRQGIAISHVGHLKGPLWGLAVGRGRVLQIKPNDLGSASPITKNVDEFAANLAVGTGDENRNVFTQEKVALGHYLLSGSPRF